MQKTSTITQASLSRLTGLSEAYISYLTRGLRRPSRKAAKLLAKHSRTTVELWFDGDPEEIQAIFKA